MTRPTPLELMQLYDGELPPDDAARVGAWLEAHPDDHAMLEGLEQLSSVLREVLDPPRHDLTEAVMARIEAHPPAEVPTSRRVAARRTPAAVTVLAASASGLLLAAAVLLWVFGPSKRSGIELVATPSAPVVSVAAVVSRPAAREPEPGASIEAVDFGARNGTIFMVSSGDGPATPVVWLVDEPPVSDGRVEPL